MKNNSFYLIAVLVLLSLFLLGCNTTPANNPYPLDGTTWVYENRREDNRRFSLSYTTDSVTFTIFTRDGSVYQEPIQGTYTLSGNMLTEVYDDYTSFSTYSGRRIVDSIDTRMIFRLQR